MNRSALNLLLAFALLLALAPAAGARPVPRMLAQDLSTSTKSVSDSSVRAGDPLTYTIVLRNTGAADAALDVTDPVPAHTTYIASSATATAGTITYTQGTNRVTWQGPVVAGDVVTLTFGVRVDPGTAYSTVIANTATVDDHTNPPLPLQATSSVKKEANFSASSKAVDPATALPGDVLTYTVTLLNTGNDVGLILFRDPIPAQTTYVPGSAVNASYSSSTNDVRCTGTLAPTASRVISFRVRIDEGLAAGALITNTAFLDSAALQLPAVATIAAAPTLRYSVKTSQPIAAASGDLVTYTLTVTNSGTVDATACITDPLAAGIVFAGSLDASAGSASYDAGNNRVLWCGPVPVGASDWVRFAAQVTLAPTATAIITNTAEIWDGFHPPFERSAPTHVPLLRLDAPATELYSGETIDLSLSLDNAPPLEGVQTRIGFDPSTLEVAEVIPASWFTPSTWTVSWDNAAGTLDLAAALDGQPAGVGGSGLLCTLRLRARAGGTSDVTVEGPLLSPAAPGAGPVSPNRRGCTVVTKDRTVSGDVALWPPRSDRSGIQVLANGSPVTRTAADGHYSFVTPGSVFTVTVALPGYLWAERCFTVGAVTETVLPAVTLLGGDMVGGNAVVSRPITCSGALTETIPGPPDGVVTIQDLAFLVGKYDMAYGDPWWGPDPCYPRYGEYDPRNFSLAYQADINDDGRVDIFDLAAASGNYKKAAPSPWP